MTVKTIIRTMIGLATFTALSSTLFAQPPVVSVWDGVYTDEQAQRGQKLSAQHCAQCHGAKLEGGEAAPPLSGENFLANWTGQRAAALFDRIRKTMPQDKPGTLSPEVNADILAYMFNVNQFPSGKSELRSDAMKQIQIDAAKPDHK